MMNCLNMFVIKAAAICRIITFTHNNSQLEKQTLTVLNVLLASISFSCLIRIPLKWETVSFLLLSSVIQFVQGTLINLWKYSFWLLSKYEWVCASKAMPHKRDMLFTWSHPRHSSFTSEICFLVTYLFIAFVLVLCNDMFMILTTPFQHAYFLFNITVFFT